MTRAQRGPKRSPTPTSATFSPTESLPPNSTPPSPIVQSPSKPLYLCSPFVEAALVKGNFKTIVMLPKYVDIMEWVAVNSTSTLVCSWKQLFSPPCQCLTFTPISMNSTALLQNAVRSRVVTRCPQGQRTCHLILRQLCSQ